MTSCLTDVHALWLLSLLSLACCTRDLVAQTVSPLERPVTTEAVTRVRDAGGSGAVEGVLRFHNSGTTAVLVSLSSCPVQLVAYRTEARRGVPAWAEKPLCTMEPRGIVLRPGARDSVWSTIPFRKILGDSLPAGRYYFELRTRYAVRPHLSTAGPTDSSRFYAFRGGSALLQR